MNNKRKLGKYMVAVTIICMTILVGILGSYAFFIGQVGQNQNQSVSVQAGNMALTFNDGNNGFSEELEFGGSAEKTFAIENSGTGDGVVDIYWKNITNTYLEGSLTYTFSESDSDNGEYIPIVETRNVPISEVASDVVLASGINVPSNSTKYYKLVITLNYTDFDQTADLDAELRTEFSIKEETRFVTVTFNAGEGTVDPGSKKVGIHSLYGELPIPERSGYDFLGWYTEEIGGEKITSDSKMETLESKILFAHWKTKIIPGVDGSLQVLGKSKKSGKPTFSTAATTDETKNGLYSIEDDYGTSYYYRGNVEDNYVKFADKYWRIIRVNGDGSLRIIYDGTSAHVNSDTSQDRLALTNQTYNSNYNDAKYVGYMYSPSGTTASTSKSQAQSNEVNSDIKTAIESWYKTNIENGGYDGYVSDNIFCNDRTTPGSAYTGWSEDTGLGYGLNETGYGAYARFLKDPNNLVPSLKCSEKNNAFTKNDMVNGNGRLSQKVGMISADEIVLAGSGKGGTKNQVYYLHKGSTYWSLTPRLLSVGSTTMFGIYSTGNLTNIYVGYSNGVAPVISLTPEYVSTMIGDGTASSPFRAEGVDA